MSNFVKFDEMWDPTPKLDQNEHKRWSARKCTKLVARTFEQN